MIKVQRENGKWGKREITEPTKDTKRNENLKRLEIQKRQIKDENFQEEGGGE